VLDMSCQTTLAIRSLSGIGITQESIAPGRAETISNDQYTNDPMQAFGRNQIEVEKEMAFIH